MPSLWTFPGTISQFSETGAENSHVQWNEVDNFSALKTFDLRSIKTSRDLLHIARDPKHDIIEKTYYLKITNFQFRELPATLSGIELRIRMNRYGRITDDEVRLSLDDEIVGENQASLSLEPIKIYGGETDKWNSNLTIQDVQNSNFGFAIRFQSHPKWPHRSPALIDAIEARIH